MLIQCTYLETIAFWTTKLFEIEVEHSTNTNRHFLKEQGTITIGT